MAVSIRSRYRGLPVFEARDSGGEVHSTIAVRPHRPPAAGATFYRHRLTGTEDLEYLAWRFLGDSEAWWRIADANPLRFPLDPLPGDVLAIPGAGEARRKGRERVFR